MHVIIVNQVLEFINDEIKSHIYRVIWNAYDGKTMALFCLNDDLATPELFSRSEIEHRLDTGTARFLQNDPFAAQQARKLADDDPDKLRRNKAYESIKSLVENHLMELFEAKTRGILVRGAAEQHGTTKRIIMLRLRTYWQRGLCENALLPQYRPEPVDSDAIKKKPGTGRPGENKPETGKKLGPRTAVGKALNISIGIKIVARSETALKLERGYKLYRLKKKYSIPKAYDDTLFTMFNLGYKFDSRIKEFVPVMPPAETLPTRDQFEYWGEMGTDPEGRRKRIQGYRKYSLTSRPVMGDSTSNLPGPGYEYQIDATIGDIYLVSSRDRSRIIGRPVIYIVIDSFSRCIVGFAVTLEGPSWLGAMLALETVTMNKVELCKQYGLTIDESEWFCHHLGQALLGDRGEIFSNNVKGLIEGLGMRVSNTPPYRADWKGIVERNFRLINTGTIKWLPGAIYDVQGRGSPDYRLDAKLTLNELRRLLILHILEHNNTHWMDWYSMDDDMATDHLDPYPLDIWNWGVINRSGSLRIKDQAIVRANLLPQAPASITDRGIYFKGLFYASDDFRLKSLVAGARRTGRIPITVSHDPRSTSQIMVPFDHGREFLTCPLKNVDEGYDGFEFYEIEDEFAVYNQRKEVNRTGDMAKRALYWAQEQKIINQADASAPDTSQLTKTERVENIKEHRKDEREYERDQAAEALYSGASIPAKSTTGQSEQESTDKPVPTPNRNRRLFEKLQEETSPND